MSVPIIRILTTQPFMNDFKVNYIFEKVYIVIYILNMQIKCLHDNSWQRKLTILAYLCSILDENDRIV